MSLVALPVAIILTIVGSLATANAVPTSKLGQNIAAITADILKPAACAALPLTNVVTGSGTISGTGGNDLILGSAGIDSIAGSGGNDCILGGGGADAIRGNGGSDVCIGGAGVDTFVSCKTQIQ